MELPCDLQTALNIQLADINTKQLLTAAQDISLRYRQRDNMIKGRHFIQNNIEALAYAISRMPATYGAVYSALKYTLENIDIQSINISSLLDIGAGTGAVSWAANELLDVDSIVCVEYDDSMRNLGKMLMADASAPLKATKWENLNIAVDSLSFQTDLVVASYVMNELEEGMQLQIAEKLWAAAKKILLFVETGTPDGYHVINKIRTKLLGQNARIIAPCFHENICPVSLKESKKSKKSQELNESKESDWCHFACRIQRSRLHKMVKGGDAPYEDEKYSYIAFAKENVSVLFESFESFKNQARILRHPQIGKGNVKLELCAKDGLKQRTYSKRDGDIYKSAKKAKCGDKI